MLIEEVLVANIVSGRTSAANDANKDIFSWTFSAAACGRHTIIRASGSNLFRQDEPQ